MGGCALKNYNEIFKRDFMIKKMGITAVNKRQASDWR